MKIDEQFLDTLELNIHTRGEMSKLISNCAQYEVRNCAHSIPWVLFIYYLKSESHFSTRTFLSVSIKQLSILPISLLTTRVPLPIHVFYPSYMCAFSWTTHILLELITYQSPRLQAILLTLFHCYVYVFGKHSVTR